jgi:hypothetical protein
MGITLASFFVVRFAVAVWIRPHYLGTLERTYPLSANRVPNPLRSDFVIGGGGPGIGGIYDAAGRFIKGGQAFCLPPMPAECVSQYGHGAYNLEIFQPASRYWLFQGIETLLFIGFAALLVAAIWWIRRRLT